MRIISGKFKGRRFNPPANNWPTRPTTDFAKEGLFNILMNELDFEDEVMLDLFGGTGNHCYEFISRGCIDATYVDQFNGALNFVKSLAEELKITPYIKIIKSDVFKYIGSTKKQYSYIFAGPPYGLKTLDTIPDKIFEHHLLLEGGIFVLEHNPSHNFTNHVNFREQRNYGTTIFSFFSHAKF